MKKQFQGLRFFAFLLVYSAHAVAFRWIDFNDYAGGGWAVSFFFALSAFMIGFGDRGEPFSWKSSVRYAWGKICKFYPLMFLAIVASTKFWKGIRCLLAGGNPVPDVWSCSPVRHLLLLQSWTSDGVFEFNAVCWFLSTLIFLYFISRLALPLLRRCGGAGLLLTAAGAWTVFALWHVVVVRAGLESRFWTYIFPPAKAPEFILAMALGLFCARHAERLTRLLSGLGRSLLAEGLLLAAFAAAVSLMDRMSPVAPVWVALDALLFVLFTFSTGPLSRFFGSRALVTLGVLSMPMFLLHPGVLNFAVNRLADMGRLPEGMGSRFGGWLACLLVALALAVAYRLIGSVVGKLLQWKRSR